MCVCVRERESVCVCVCERERERETDRQTDRQTEAETQRERETNRDREYSESAQMLWQEGDGGNLVTSCRNQIVTLATCDLENSRCSLHQFLFCLCWGLRALGQRQEYQTCRSLSMELWGFCFRHSNNYLPSPSRPPPQHTQTPDTYIPKQNFRWAFCISTNA